MEERIQFGEFFIPIPATWQAEEVGGVLELLPPTLDGAAHFSLLKRTRLDPPTSGDAIELVENFALHQGLKVIGKIDTREARDQARAEALLQTAVASTGPTYWKVLVVVSKDAALRGSYCCDDVKSAAFEAGQALLANVELAADRSRVDSKSKS